MAKRLTMFILIAMIAGIVVGITLNRTIILHAGQHYMAKAP